MSKKIININLNPKSIENAIKELEYIKNVIPKINEEFMKESLTWISYRADTYLDQRTKNFPNTANVSKNWSINQVQPQYGGVAFELRNDNDVVGAIEFGTGIVGKNMPHKKADELNYEYDVNGHLFNGWSFYNEQANVYMRGFTGYKGKSFLYDAFWDYYFLEEYINIYKRIYDKYIK